MDLSHYLKEDTPEEVDEQATPGANLDEMVLTDSKPESIVDVLNAYLKTPRFPGDACIVLSMPDATLKKYKEKLNNGLWWFYTRYCKKDFGMMEILVAVEKMVDATKLTTMLDTDIKMLVAKERGLVVTEEDLENAMKSATSKKAEKAEEAQTEEDVPKYTTMNDEDFMEKLMEDDPEEEAEMLAGLGVMDDDEEGESNVQV